MSPTGICSQGFPYRDDYPCKDIPVGESLQEEEAPLIQPKNSGCAATSALRGQMGLAPPRLEAPVFYASTGINPQGFPHRDNYPCKVIPVGDKLKRVGVSRCGS
jgi:hypothetical protein